MKYIDADLLRKEIEKLEEEARKVRVSGTDKEAIGADGKVKLCLKLKSLVDSLQQGQQEEPDKSLEKEITRWLNEGDITDTRFDDYDDSDIEKTARHFAEWQASQMPMPEDTVLFNKEVAEGRRLEREDMMKEAVEWEVIANLANRPVIYLYQLHGFKPGDKVKVIVLKDNEDESK